MPTTVVSSIGATGRDYATIAAWIAACPTNLVSDDKIWKGECYNDSEFFVDGAILVNIPNTITTDATRYLWLTTATGQSFKDHASKLTNSPKYNQANGVALRTTGFSDNVIYTARKVIISGLQIYGDTTYAGHNAVVIDSSSSSGAAEIKDCIIESRAATQVAYAIGSAGSTWVNNVIVDRSSAGATCFRDDGAGSVVTRVRNCTIVRPSDLTAGGTGVRANNSDTILINSSVFGFSTAFHANAFDTTNSKNNATNAASAPGSSNQTSKTFSSQFETVTDSARDFRAKSSGSDLANNAIRDQTYTNDLDIVGQTRSTTTPTIGAWEVVGGGGAAAEGGGMLLGSRRNRLTIP